MLASDTESLGYYSLLGLSIWKEIMARSVCCQWVSLHPLKLHFVRISDVRVLERVSYERLKQSCNLTTKNQSFLSVITDSIYTQKPIEIIKTLFFKRLNSLNFELFTAYYCNKSSCHTCLRRYQGGVQELFPKEEVF